MEGRFGFHGKPPTPEQAEEALKELESRYEEQTGQLGSDTPLPEHSEGDGAPDPGLGEPS